MEPNKIKASVLVVTYNHERYISQAIDSVLMQECSFDYEIVIADDCSTDSTKVILQRYAEKYPHKIRLIPTDLNLGVTKNYRRSFKECKGEYIAVLEGDDYWTSPFKLGRQVKFLHEHRECVLCFNRLIYFYENEGRFYFYPEFEIDRDYKLFMSIELIRNNFIGNFSACVYRKSAIEALDESLYNMKVYDWMFNIVISQYGMIGYLPEVMSMYRKHPKSTFAGKTVEQQEEEVLALIDIYNDYLENKFEDDFQYMRQKYIASKDARTKENSTEEPAKIIRRKTLSRVGHMVSLLTPEIVKVTANLVLPPLVIKAVRKLWNKIKG